MFHESNQLFSNRRAAGVELASKLRRYAGRNDVVVLALPRGGVPVAFEVADGMLVAIARVVDAERQCCQFLRFHITVEPDGGPIHVDLSGPPGTREFASALLES